MQKQGKSVVTVVTNEFEALAKSEMESLGATDHPLLVVPHPIGSLSPDQVHSRANQGFSRLQEVLLNRENDEKEELPSKNDPPVRAQRSP